MSLEIKIVNKSKNVLPEYETSGASGMDLRANLEEDVILKPFERAIIPTGIYLDIPHGYEAQIRPRSGLAAKHGVSVLNTPGTIN
jgi:dUTP pyrophosphatase